MSRAEKITLKSDLQEEVRKTLSESDAFKVFFNQVFGSTRSASREEKLIKKIEDAIVKLEALKNTLFKAENQPDIKMHYADIDAFNREVDEILSTLKIG